MVEKSAERLAILEKINEYEKKGWWDKDVEDDPETIPLQPDKVDYLGKKLSSKIKSYFANKVAIAYFDKEIKKGNLIIKEIIGFENYLSVKGGAMITCNHFNPYDNYVVFKAIQKSLGKKHLYRVIREGNYTNFKGIYGFFFRNCNTLPLSSVLATMKNFLRSVNTLLTRGEKILIYPEQGMWWNYRKPRPVKSGAFKFAVSANVPIIPAFITMTDSDKIGADGFNLQEYHLHFLPPIYPKEDFTDKENIEYMAQENYRLWKETYEKFYGVPLTYEKE